MTYLFYRLKIDLTPAFGSLARALIQAHLQELCSLERAAHLLELNLAHLLELNLAHLLELNLAHLQELSIRLTC